MTGRRSFTGGPAVPGQPTSDTTAAARHLRLTADRFLRETASRGELLEACDLFRAAVASATEPPVEDGEETELRRRIVAAFRQATLKDAVMAAAAEPPVEDVCARCGGMRLKYVDSGERTIGGDAIMTAVRCPDCTGTHTESGGGG